MAQHQWTVISAHSQRPRVRLRLSLISNGQARLTAMAARQLREAAGLSDDEVLRVQVMTNPEKTMLAVSADPDGCVVDSISQKVSMTGVRTFLGSPRESVHIDLEWDADQGLLIGAIPEQLRPDR